MSETNVPQPLRPLARALGVAKGWFSALSRPARVLIVATTVAAVATSGLVGFEKVNEPYAALFTQLERDDAAAIVAKLKEQKVPYRLGPDGTTVEVPETRAHELRLELAGSGLPRGGGVGFESFDKMRLGATDFEQRVLYRRALEGELTRTIGTIGAVESARVHLVLPEKSVFVSRSEPASASIVLRLRPGRSLGSSEVAGIVHLVAAAVPSLVPDRVAVVTTDGLTLHRPRTSASEDDVGSDEDGRSLARSYESTIEERVRAMLEKVVGAGHADVRVTAEIESARVERVEEHFDPTKTILRSEESSVERASGEAEDTVAGVPGAESNLPTGSAKGSSSGSSAKPASSTASATPPPGSVRESHTRNFEIDKVSEKRVSSGGALKRLAVAVVLDHPGGKVRPREELEKIAALVRSAAGANDSRGDVVTVEDMAFAEDPSAEPPPPPPSPIAVRLQQAKKWGIPAGGVVLLLAAVGAGLALRGRQKAQAPATAELPAALPPPAIEAAVRPVLDSADLRTRAHARAAQDPATAALVLRFWLGTSASEVRDAPKS